MRLICPNCDAQYEVDDSVIPENGRDVQCSNCGHTWFQNAAGWEDQAVAVEEEAPVPEPEAAPLPAPEPELDEPDAPEIPDTVDLSETGSSERSEPDRPDQIIEEDAPAEIPPRELEEDVSSILREEAERETAQRASENVGLETQPDLGLDEQSGDHAPDVKDRMARLRGLDDDLGASTAASAVAGAHRADLLPDIEEINSTLTASAEDVGDGSEQAIEDTQQRRGFRRGFAITILIFAVLCLIYILAPRIAEVVPGAGPLLASYVDWVNTLRAAVDNLMQSAVDRLTVLVTQVSGNRSG